MISLAESLNPFQQAFNRALGSLKFVTILSPT